MSVDLLVVNQTLHGYNEGHTLLNSSLELPIEVRRLMLSMSDLSGSSIEVGFEEYLTGYPLKEIGMYALAKTWYASEMRRPGCVWTHTLLLKFVDLPKILNIDYLLELFVRPQIGEIDQNFFNNSISLSAEITKANYYDRNDHNFEYLSSIVESLYKSNKAITIPSTSSANFEKAFLLIWRQQWPRLKRNFSFCTGSMTLRSFKGIPLDIQSTPFSIYISLEFKNKIQHLEDLSSRKIDSIEEKWVEVAVKSLFSPSEKLSSFLKLYGSDLSIKRVSFKNLVETYIFFKDNKPKLEESLMFVALKFPTSKEAHALKNELLNEKEDFTNKFLPFYSEESVLFFLSTIPYDDSFDYIKLGFYNRFFDFLIQNPSKGTDLLKEIIHYGPNIHGEHAITRLTLSEIGSELLKIIWEDRQLSAVFMGLNPKLAVSSSFWIANQYNALETIKQLQKTLLSDDDWNKIIEFIIELEIDIDPRIFVELGNNIVTKILHHLNNQSIFNVPKRWSNFITSNPNEILEWFAGQENVRTEIVELLVGILNPNSNVILKFGLKPWLKYLTNNKVVINEDITIDVFYLTLAFNFRTLDTQLIFSIFFERVYFGLLNNRIDYNLWLNIEPHTKSLSFWRDWDRCQKLIYAVVDMYSANKWHIKNLAQKMKNDDLGELLIYLAKRRK